MRVKFRVLVTAVLGVVLIGSVAVAQAQETLVVAEELELSRSVNQAKRQATISANLQFTAQEMGLFWQEYWAYRTEVNKIDDTYIQLIQEYSKSYESMSNQKAKKLTEAWLRVVSDRVELKKRYIEKFNSVLPAAKTLRVMQIENKLDVMLDASVAKQIPLVVPGG